MLFNASKIHAHNNFQMFVNGRNISSPTTTLIPTSNARLPHHFYPLNFFRSPRPGPTPTSCIPTNPLVHSAPPRATVSASSSLRPMTSHPMTRRRPTPPRPQKHPPLFLPSLPRCLYLKTLPVSKLYPICPITHLTSYIQHNLQALDLDPTLVST